MGCAAKFGMRGCSLGAAAAGVRWALSTFHDQLANFGRILTDEQRASIVDLGQLFLDCYQALARHAWDVHLRQWHIVPKFHYFVHALLDIRSTGLNPRHASCYCDEDWVGQCARVSRRPHRATVARRSLERYLDRLRVRPRP